MQDNLRGQGELLSSSLSLRQSLRSLRFSFFTAEGTLKAWRAAEDEFKMENAKSKCKGWKTEVY